MTANITKYANATLMAYSSVCWNPAVTLFVLDLVNRACDSYSTRNDARDTKAKANM